MKSNPVLSKTVLVTGCSTGIGLATARLLRDKGWNVIPTARKAEDVDRLHKEGFTPLMLDIADGESVRRAAEEALRMTGGALGALVNNAGFGQPGAIEDLTRDAMRYQFEVNVFGLQELTNRLMPVFHKQGYGRIVNISSVLGRITIPFMGIYSASKHALESMSDAMRVELTGTGIAVSIVEPGPIKTDFGKNALARSKEQLPRVESRFKEQYKQKALEREKEQDKPHLFALPPEAVALKILHALESPRPRRRYAVTFVAHVGAFMRRFLPDALMDILMGVKMRKSE